MMMIEFYMCWLYSFVIWYAYILLTDKETEAQQIYILKKVYYE